MPAEGTPDGDEHHLADAIDANVNAATHSASFYDAVWPELVASMDYTQAARVRFVVEAISELTNGRDLTVLDFGCGMGWMAPFLSRFGRVTGIDFGEEGIRIARKLYRDEATFILADPDSPSLGLGSAAFDVVVASEVIEHVPDHTAFLIQVARLVRPGGWCVLTTPNGNVWEEFRRHPQYGLQLQPNEHWLRPKELTRLLRAAGFRVMRHEGRPVYTFRHGWSASLQSKSMERRMAKFGLSRLWGRLILSGALYQVVAARLESLAASGRRT
jgi:2-polyprenyl-3-methyl-5-hydroxy-6-metoxy-1,4-benzoquinol methylase